MTSVTAFAMRVPPGWSQRTRQHVPAEERAERRRERTVDDMADARPAVDRRLDRVGQADVVLDDPAVREREPEDRGVGIGPGRDLDHRPLDQLVDEAVAVGVGDEEPTILDDAFRLDPDLVAGLEPEAPDGGDVQSADTRHAPMLADDDVADPPHIRKTPNRVSGIGAWSAASMPIARTRRVSSGSMTPSSQRRAVAKYGEPSRS